ncbi:hypothetical protein ACROYT_G020741 [Oculina patagonica]
MLALLRRFLDTVTKSKNVARDKTGKATKYSLLLEKVFGYTTVSKIKRSLDTVTKFKYVATDMTGKAMKNEIFGYSCQVQECGKEMRSWIKSLETVTKCKTDAQTGKRPWLPAKLL